MKVNWKDFAQRRKLSLDMFLNMPYKNYVEWCVQRQVIPATEQEFPRVFNELVDTTTDSKATTDPKKLKKLKKDVLIRLCKENDINFNLSDTKKILIEKLIDVNN